MAHTLQLPSTPLFRIPVKNYGVSDIAQGTPLSLDTTNAIGTLERADGIGVIPIAAAGNPVMGVAAMTIPAGGTGSATVIGVEVMRADGAITAGQVIDGSNTALKGAKTHAVTKFAIGVALSTALDNEDVLVLVNVGGANNA